MRNILLVAWREFWQRLRTRGFVLTALGMPLIILVVVGGSSLAGGGEVSIGVNTSENTVAEPLPGEAPAVAIGYVDQAGLIERIPPPLPEELFVAFADVESANAALERTAQEARTPTSELSDPINIEAYYIIPPDYREAGIVRRVSRELPAGEADTTLFDSLLLANLFPNAPTAELMRLRAPFQSRRLPVVEVGLETDEPANGSPMMPFLVAIVIMLPLFMSGGYLLYSLVEEKSNRVMEILLVSLRPRDLLAGKLLGLGALTAVQYAIWAVLGLAALFITGSDLGTLSEMVNLTAGELGLVLVYGLGGYWLNAGLMAGIGALSPDLESSRTWTFVISLPMLIPLYLWTAITADPHGPLAVSLSFIPFSSPLAMLMRMASTTVPGWQVVTSLALLMLTAAGIVWLMARLFRVQTLLSGESFSVGRFWRVLREA